MEILFHTVESLEWWVNILIYLKSISIENILSRSALSKKIMIIKNMILKEANLSPPPQIPYTENVSIQFKTHRE